MKKYEDFEGMVIFPIPPRKFAIRTGSVIVHNIFAYFTVSSSTSQEYVIQGKMLVLPNRLLC